MSKIQELGMAELDRIFTYLMSIGGKDIVYRWHITDKSLVWTGYDDTKHVISLRYVYMYRGQDALTYRGA